MNILKGLEPQKVFKFFEEMSQIPRGSGDEKAISNYLVDFAKQRNLEVFQDEALNVVIKKPATEGYENVDGVIIQGHMDMVNEKNSDTEHDFSKDPIKLIVEGDLIRADGTTLGADNGIALAMGLALLDSNEYHHPKICLVATSEEETGMSGAFALDGSILEGNKYFLNVDSDKEGLFIVSCAGGVRQYLEIDAVSESISSDFKAYEIKVRGLNGGHSGIEIQKELANANKVMGRVLYRAFHDHDILISKISGGLKDNAIPREADVTIMVNPNDAKALEALVEEMNETLKNEFKLNEQNLTVSIEKIPCENCKKEAFSKDVTKKIIATIMVIPNGVQAMALGIDGLVETSNNLGVIITEENRVVFTSATRSSVVSRKQFMQDQLRQIADLVGAKYRQDGNYPGWAYEPDSKLRDVCMEVYENMFGKKAEIEAIHAGLECGLFSEKVAGLDIISFGPNISAQHTPEETLSISSTENVWKLLIEVLKNLK